MKCDKKDTTPDRVGLSGLWIECRSGCVSVGKWQRSQNFLPGTDIGRSHGDHTRRPAKSPVLVAGSMSTMVTAFRAKGLSEQLFCTVATESPRGTPRFFVFSALLRHNSLYEETRRSPVRAGGSQCKQFRRRGFWTLLPHNTAWRKRAGGPPGLWISVPKVLAYRSTS